MPRSPELVISILALLFIGATVVPVDQSNPKQRLLALLEQADPVCVACSQVTQQLLGGWSGRTLKIDLKDIQNAYSNPAAGSSTAVPQVAYLLFTSGSTGVPKGVLIGHQALYLSLKALSDVLGINRKTRMLGVASISFDIAWLELVAPLMQGAQVTLLDDNECQSPEYICELISSGKVNCVQATPSLWKLLLMQGWQAQSDFILISGGEVLPRDLAQNLWDKQGDFWSLYGPTEATIWAMAQQVTRSIFEQSPNSIYLGKSLGHSRFSIREDITEFPHKGELCLSGPNLAFGYFRQPQLNKEVFFWKKCVLEGEIKKCHRWYCTGDLVENTDYGLRFLARIDRQVKVNGYRIELDEIEQSLKQHSSVADVVVTVSCSGLGNRKYTSSLIVANIVAVAGSHNKTSLKFNEFLSKTLPQYMLPNCYRFLERIPLTINRKIDFNALAELGKSELISDKASTDASVVNRIKKRICELLEIPDIGMHDSFFDQGGSSILSATLLMTLNADFDLDIPLGRVLARPPTVSYLYSLIEAERRIIEQAAI